ncbi:MAG: alpha/beta fold hydrolase [Chlamydiia bacterium]|nr:alpha/beta fold hydrolase [Chlamydiia bacterium]
MPKIKANDIEIYYERHGKGPLLLMVCGFATHIGMMEKMIPLLSKNFEVIVFDNRGSGKTAATPPPYTIEMLSNDVLSFLDALGIQKAFMAGFSMGAAIIQSFALHHPERIHKGVLIAPFTVLPKTAIMLTESISKLFQAGVEPTLVLETLLPWIYSNHFLSDPQRIKNTLEEMANDPYPQPPEGYAGQLEAVITFDLSERLSEITTPLLILAGEEDLYTPLYEAKALEKGLENGTLQVIPKVGHMIHVEAMDAVVEGINAFCRS